MGTPPPRNATWAFWSPTDGATPFGSIVSRSWSRLAVAGRTRRTARLRAYRYNVVRGADFYRYAHDKLSRLPNVEFVRGRADRIEDGAEGAHIHVSSGSCTGEYAGRWVFDSRFRLPAFRKFIEKHPGRYRYLEMQFRGWEIETACPAFDPLTPTFLDFHTPQGEPNPAGQALSFFYVLPYSSHRALVEYVVCHNSLLHREQQAKALDGYIREVLGIADYRIPTEEQGINPMTDYPFRRRMSAHAMCIGIPGGMLKPTTGFAFTRIQRDSAAIVRSLLSHGHPFDVPHIAAGYRLYERLMLTAMAHHGKQAARLLTTFFKYGSTDHILRFLDEQGTPF
jgi:lycopene beta-cyclase